MRPLVSVKWPSQRVKPLEPLNTAMSHRAFNAAWFDQRYAAEEISHKGTWTLPERPPPSSYSFLNANDHIFTKSTDGAWGSRQILQILQPVIHTAIEANRSVWTLLDFRFSINSWEYLTMQGVSNSPHHSPIQSLSLITSNYHTHYTTLHLFLSLSLKKTQEHQEYHDRHKHHKHSMYVLHTLSLCDFLHLRISTNLTVAVLTLAVAGACSFCWPTDQRSTISVPPSSSPTSEVAERIRSLPLHQLTVAKSILSASIPKPRELTFTSLTNRKYSKSIISWIQIAFPNIGVSQIFPTLFMGRV